MYRKLFFPLLLLFLFLIAACGGQAGLEFRPFEGTLTAQYYYLPEGTEALPDFDSLTPDGTIEKPTLNVPERSYIRGFPGVPDRREYFGVLYTGSFALEQPGGYGFRLLSDDGSRLYIDGELVADNNGTHPVTEAEGAVNLEAGTHRLRVEYFQGPREEIALQLFVTLPGEEEQIFSVSPSVVQ